MGYPLQAGAPKITVQGRTLAVGAFDWPTPMGDFYKVGVYEKQPDGSWNELNSVATYTNSGDALAAIQAKGGTVKYIQWVCDKVNAFFATLFGPTPPPPITEPTTEAEARLAITGSVNALSLVLIGGVPVLK